LGRSPHANKMPMTENEEREGGSPREPSPDEIRAARHAGFADSTRYVESGRRERFMKPYLEQDQRRERNISKFGETYQE
jgi:hypothetical protein